MSKKKRSKRAAAARRQRAQVARTSGAEAGGATRKARPSAAEQKEVDFASEYRYVVSDLKRFGILAVVMFAALIALALLLG